MKTIGKILLILLLIANSFASDYFISFDLIVKNNILKAYNFNCSKALTSIPSKKKFLFSLPFYKSIIKTCKKYENNIIDQLLKNEVFISSFEIVTNGYLNQKEKIIFLPKRFDIIIKDGRIFFYLKEKDENSGG